MAFSKDSRVLSPCLVVSLYGSEDGVLNREEYRGNLLENTEESILRGGYHVWFSSYGAQDGDGIPTITNEEQLCVTAEKSSDW